ncbi:hypothetical protein KSX_85170 [Ktedonospora formicarum]|uniref:Uncharacterized protein n=1 Tax=Ktedonospora formicarum TaxID=2778364 RepID=A0A8J3I699_9CHLR|nr:hypothetical protein KSX_85170 [Ktedonospora formicarum]
MGKEAKEDHATVSVRRTEKEGSYKGEVNRCVETYGNMESDKKELPRKRRLGIFRGAIGINR